MLRYLLAESSLTLAAPRELIWLAGSMALMVVLAIVSKVPIGYSLRNLRVRWLTTLMTTLAFTLVVSLLVVMLAFVNGMNKLNDNSGQPGNVIVFSNGATDELFSELAFSGTGDVSRSPGVLRNDNDEPLASFEVFRVVVQPVQQNDEQAAATGNNGQRRPMQVRGLDDPVIGAQVHGMELYPGGAWFSQAGVQEVSVGDKKIQALQAVLGQGLAAQLGADRGKSALAIGDLFDLGPRKAVVTGIMQSAGSAFGSEVWAKRAIIGPLFGKESYSTIVVRSAGPADAVELCRYLNEDYKQANLFAQPETEYYSKLSETNRQFTYSIVIVTFLMAIGGVFGVMNTMFAAIAQRTKDIGVLRIIGFARWQVLVVFFLESLLLAIIGGAMGCALGSLSDGWTATSIVSSGTGPGKTVILTLLVTADTLLIGMLLAMGMGALGGLVPAISAMRLRPLESMR
jgi:ABC-type lipoprotein release transport system permease subunit